MERIGSNSRIRFSLDILEDCLTRVNAAEAHLAYGKRHSYSFWKGIGPGSQRLFECKIKIKYIRI